MNLGLSVSALPLGSLHLWGKEPAHFQPQRCRERRANAEKRKAKTVKKLISVIAIVSFRAFSIAAQDITSLEKIGPVSSIERFDKGVVLTSADNSRVQITVLAADLIRVRTVFNQTLPQRDHSWAIARETEVFRPRLDRNSR